MGDYSRLLDYVRSTMVCADFCTFAEVLTWLCTDAAPIFKVCRIKDRISREGNYDPDTSGGNRDVLLNGWLDLGPGRKLIVEIQIHLLELYELKADLHALYDDARMLGAKNVGITCHEGTLSD